MADDTLDDIPEFLKRTPQQIAEWWREHPPVATPEDQRAIQDAGIRAAEKKARTQERIEKLKTKRAAQKAKQEFDEEWERKRGWPVHVDKNKFRMTHAQFKRCMSEMPSEEHRAEFKRRFGPPMGY